MTKSSITSSESCNGGKFFKNSNKIRKSGGFNQLNACSCTCLCCNMKDSHGSSWVRGKFLGKGGYSTVFFAQRKTDTTGTISTVHRLPQQMAIKSAKISQASSIMHERDILGGLGCPFVVSCYGDEITKTREGEGVYNLILEYCSGLSLLDHVNEYSGGLPEDQARVFARDILKGLIYIHTRGIIHCDIKPENVLLVPQATWLRRNGYVAKIADFGLAVESDSVEAGLARGTLRYTAPEMVREEVFSYGVDVWSFGCSVLEMLTGTNVWGKEAGLGKDHLIHLIGYTNSVPKISSSVSALGRHFLERCLVRDPRKRWSTDALLRHPFLDIEPR